MTRFSIALLAALVFLPAAANAYVPSPRYGAFELKFGPWRPNADRVPGIEGTYTDFFKNRSMFNATLELDWQFARVPGVMSFGVGGAWGFMREEGKARAEGNASVDENGDTISTSDEVALNVMPLALLAVIRLDVLPEKARIPIVPFFKIGLDWFPWWSRLNGHTDDSGGTLGWQFNAGIAVQLDWTDPMTARTFDNEVGVNHSYLFFEYIQAHVEGLGADGHLYLSPTNIGAHGTWAVGICLEF